MAFRLCTVIPGVLIICFALVEIFEDLFHPTASGSLSGWVAKSVARLFHRRPSILPAAGPLSLVLVILCWAFLLAGGFALVYWASFPHDFDVKSGRTPMQETGFSPVLYFSLQVITNLGLGDFTPKLGWLRIAITIEAFLGIALITASVSWIVLLYPALSRMRELARRTAVLAKASKDTGIDLISEGAEHLLSQLALGVIRIRVDLIHFPILYYFYEENEQSSLAHAAPELSRMSEAASKADEPRLRLDAAVLRTALDDVARVLARDFLDMDGKDTDAVFRAWAEDHVISATTTN